MVFIIPLWAFTFYHTREIACVYHMKISVPNHLHQFLVIGTNFTKADTQTRSRFAITKLLSEEVYYKASHKGLTDFLILSTCNRTEFYACGPAAEVKELVAAQLSLSENDLATYFYVYAGEEAVRHFFRVVAGLDSQIVGDYEIVCQVKAALETARQFQLVGTFIDRVANFAFQASKKVKAHTNLSSGKYSVSYAAAGLIEHQRANNTFDHILLVGTGDFGATVARNLRHYFPRINLTVTNRTHARAEKLALQVRASVIPFETFRQQLKDFDVVITTVGQQTYLITRKDITGSRPQLILDLSVPQAVDPEVKLIEGIRHYSVDEISSFHNELLKQRTLEIPHAEKILDVFIDRFLEWHQVYYHRHILTNYKEKIKSLLEPVQSVTQQYEIENTFSGLIQHIRTNGYAGCDIIEAVNKLVPSGR
jgi:glutamyl-tRNA reductase